MDCYVDVDVDALVGNHERGTDFAGCGFVVCVFFFSLVVAR